MLFAGSQSSKRHSITAYTAATIKDKDYTVKMRGNLRIGLRLDEGKINLGYVTVKCGILCATIRSNKSERARQGAPSVCSALTRSHLLQRGRHVGLRLAPNPTYAALIAGYGEPYIPISRIAV